MNGQEMTYSEKLKIAWLLTWRALLIGFGIGFAFGFLVGIVGALMGVPQSWITSISSLGGFLLGILFVGPLVVGMTMRKQFDGFRLQIVRV